MNSYVKFPINIIVYLKAPYVGKDLKELKNLTVAVVDNKILICFVQVLLNNLKFPLVEVGFHETNTCILPND